MWHKLRPTLPRECCLVSPLSLLRSVGPSHRAQDDGASHTHLQTGTTEWGQAEWLLSMTKKKKKTCWLPHVPQGQNSSSKYLKVVIRSFHLALKPFCDHQGREKNDFIWKMKGHLSHDPWTKPGHIQNAGVNIYYDILPSITSILFAEPGMCFGHIPLHKRTHSSDKAEWYLTILLVVCTLTSRALCQLSRASCSVRSCHCSGANLDITFYVPSTP